MPESLVPVFRLYKSGRLPDDPMGAYLAGGRWNPPGYRMLYTSTHLSLACLEVLAHVTPNTVPRQLSYAWAELPLVTDCLDPQKNLIRRGMETTAEIGKQWLVQSGELAIRVPSIIIPEEDNILLNPNNPAYDLLSWTTKPFDWDTRLLNLFARSPSS